MLYNGSEVIRDLEWVIFDEVHYINDAEVMNPLKKSSSVTLFSLLHSDLICCCCFSEGSSVGGSAHHVARAC